MSNDELGNLSQLILDDGNIKFDIKGFGRNKNDDTVILLTDGGSLTYNFEGIIYSTGNARALLEAIFGEDIHVDGSEGQRNLWCTCGEGNSAIESAALNNGSNGKSDSVDSNSDSDSDDSNSDSDSVDSNSDTESSPTNNDSNSNS